jgi:Ser/Thr protein kinase RdoA (MazF antagonist)
VLSAGQTRAATAILARAWGEPVTLETAEPIWERSHVVRLGAAAGRTAVLKRERKHGRSWPTFDMEAAVLDYLNAMPVPVAPRLFGTDADAGILIMEDLGEGSSLADSLLAGPRDRVQADLVAYGRALGSLHAWSMGHPGGLAGLRAKLAPGAAPETKWLEVIRRHGPVFLSAAASLGVAVDGVAEEIDQIVAMVSGTGYAGLVHGDACPDNVRITGGNCRIFDFETSGWGTVAFDAAYLVAPFPSCWCFAALPAEVAGAAVDAYEARLAEAGVTLGPDWADLITAALAGLIVTRAPLLAGALKEDHDWGTTTIRPRLLAWLGSFTGRASHDTVPRFQATVGAMRERLAELWPGVRIPEYPALAGPGAVLARIPDGWQPRP